MTIATKLHDLQQAVHGTTVRPMHAADDDQVVPGTEADLNNIRALVDRMYAAPKFCISPEVVELLSRDDVGRAVKAVIDAGIARLPYDPILIEYNVRRGDLPENYSPCRHFVLFSEVADGISAEWAALQRQEDRMVALGADPVRLWLSEASGINIEGWSSELQCDVICVAAELAFLMLNVRGISKEVIHTDKLNRARAAKADGRPPIPQHTILHIGTVYDRAGEGHNFNQTGRHMPVHLRSGYVRGQWFGKGREDYKTVYIPPCLVNYREQDAAHPPRLPEKEIRV